MSIAETLRGARASFTTLFRRYDDLFAEVRSTWCCIDALTRRPVRLARDIADLLFADDRNPMA